MIYNVTHVASSPVITRQGIKLNVIIKNLLYNSDKSEQQRACLQITNLTVTSISILESRKLLDAIVEATMMSLLQRDCR